MSASPDVALTAGWTSQTSSSGTGYQGYQSGTQTAPASGYRWLDAGYGPIQVPLGTHAAYGAETVAAYGPGWTAAQNVTPEADQSPALSGELAQTLLTMAAADNMRGQS